MTKRKGGPEVTRQLPHSIIVNKYCHVPVQTDNNSLSGAILKIAGYFKTLALQENEPKEIRGHNKASPLSLTYEQSLMLQARDIHRIHS